MFLLPVWPLVAFLHMTLPLGILIIFHLLADIVYKIVAAPGDFIFYLRGFFISSDRQKKCGTDQLRS